MKKHSFFKPLLRGGKNFVVKPISWLGRKVWNNSAPAAGLTAGFGTWGLQSPGLNVMTEEASPGLGKAHYDARHWLKENAPWINPWTVGLGTTAGLPQLKKLTNISKGKTHEFKEVPNNLLRVGGNAKVQLSPFQHTLANIKANPVTASLRGIGHGATATENFLNHPAAMFGIGSLPMTPVIKDINDQWHDDAQRTQHRPEKPGIKQEIYDETKKREQQRIAEMTMAPLPTDPEEREYRINYLNNMLEAIQHHPLLKQNELNLASFLIVNQGLSPKQLPRAVEILKENGLKVIQDSDGKFNIVYDKNNTPNNNTQAQRPNMPTNSTPKPAPVEPVVKGKGLQPGTSIASLGAPKSTEEPSWFDKMPNWGKGLGLGAGALGAGLLANSLTGEDEDEEGNKKKNMPWLGPLVGLGGLAAGAHYLSGGDYGKLIEPSFWTGSNADRGLDKPASVKRAFYIPLIAIKRKVRIKSADVFKVLDPEYPTLYPNEIPPKPEIPKPEKPITPLTIPGSGRSNPQEFPDPKKPEIPKSEPIKPIQTPSTDSGFGNRLANIAPKQTIQPRQPNLNPFQNPTQSAQQMNPVDVAEAFSALPGPPGVQKAMAASVAMALSKNPTAINSEVQFEKFKQQEIKKNPFAQQQPGFLENLWDKFNAMPMWQRILIGLGLGMGVYSLISSMSGGNSSSMSPLLGIGGLLGAGYLAYRGGLFDGSKAQGAAATPGVSAPPDSLGLRTVDDVKSIYATPDKLKLALTGVLNPETRQKFLHHFAQHDPTARQYLLEQAQMQPDKAILNGLQQTYAEADKYRMQLAGQHHNWRQQSQQNIDTAPQPQFSDSQLMGLMNKAISGDTNSLQTLETYYNSLPPEEQLKKEQQIQNAARGGVPGADKALQLLQQLKGKNWQATGGNANLNPFPNPAR